MASAKDLSISKLFKNSTIELAFWVRIFSPVVVVVATVIAIIGGSPPYLVLVLLGIETLLVLFSPIVVPATAIIVAPLLGQTVDYSIGPLNAVAILALWFLVIGGGIVFLNLGKVLGNRLVVIQVFWVMLNAASVLVSSFRMTTLEETLRVTSVMLMLPLIYLLSGQQKNRKMIVYIILASAIIPLGFGVYQKATGNLDFGHQADIAERATGLQGVYSTFWDIHPFAKFLMVIAVLTFVLFVFEDNSMYRKGVLGLFFAISLILLVYTYARSQLIGFFVAIFVILYGMKKLNAKTVILLALLLVPLLIQADIFARFADLFQPLHLDTNIQVNTLKFRIVLWRKGLPLALRKPFLGHGADTFKEIVGIVAHNDYLGLFFDFGLVGPFLYLLFLGLAAKRAWMVARSKICSEFDRGLGLVVLGISAAVIALSAFENIARDTTMWWVYMALIGCIESAVRSTKRIHSGLG